MHLMYSNSITKLLASPHSVTALFLSLVRVTACSLRFGKISLGASRTWLIDVAPLASQDPALFAQAEPMLGPIRPARFLTSAERLQ